MCECPFQCFNYKTYSRELTAVFDMPTTCFYFISGPVLICVITPQHLPFSGHCPASLVYWCQSKSAQHLNLGKRGAGRCHSKENLRRNKETQVFRWISPLPVMHELCPFELNPWMVTWLPSPLILGKESKQKPSSTIFISTRRQGNLTCIWLKFEGRSQDLKLKSAQFKE